MARKPVEKITAKELADLADKAETLVLSISNEVTYDRLMKPSDHTVSSLLNTLQSFNRLAGSIADIQRYLTALAEHIDNNREMSDRLNNQIP